jgi:hypothetical protein
MVMEKVINLSSYIDRIGPAEYLVQEAVSKGSGDDQTALVLDLNKYRKGLLKPHHATFSGVSPLERTIKKGTTHDTHDTQTTTRHDTTRHDTTRHDTTRHDTTPETRH